MNLKEIPSIGVKVEKTLEQLNITDIESLVEYYPFKYNFIKIESLKNNPKDNIYVLAEVVSDARVSFIKKNFNRLAFKVLVENQLLNVTIFNRAFLKNNIVLGSKIILFGKYDNLKASFMAADIKLNSKENSIEPVYRLKKGIKNQTIQKYISKALEYSNEFVDKIPSYKNQEYSFMSKKDAIKAIHLPQNINELKKAQIRIIYEELFEFMFKINYRKIKRDEQKGIKRKIEENKLDLFINSLGFKPTKDQLTAFNEVKEDLVNEKKMQRLVLGDVGSGKTLVATYAIYLNFLSNMQTALLVPTEILATQHYKNMKNYFKNESLTVEIITGKMSKKEKNTIAQRLLAGEIDLLIGTHALISKEIIFKNLTLVITDEQHRFGVNQRKSLENKGISPDILYLSATPIPRTYSLILYKDTDVSIIKTKPKNRKEVVTKVLNEKNIKEVLHKIYNEIKLGRQAFVVCSLIENEESDLNSVITLKQKLSLAFQDKVNIEIIHGNMKDSEKESIMNDFKEREIDIVISTTVIEVGIDIPNATVMAIFNAERFGLATLHQLRGRVGRGNYEGYCYLISDINSERLKIMEESSDGFYITEKDYELRKEGDLFGTKQSGELNFKVANLKRDLKILLKAREDSEEFLQTNKYKESKYYMELIEKINNLI